MATPPTQETIAKKLGISRATVAEILGGRNAHRYNEKTRDRVTEVAKALGYRPNRQARVLSGAKSGVIGIIKSVSIHQRNVELVLKIGAEIDRRGYDIISSDLLWNGDVTRVVHTLQDLKVEGVILAHHNANFALKPDIQRLIRGGMPMVCVGGDRSQQLTHITADYFQAATDAVHHLKACGYERIVVVSRPNWDHPDHASHSNRRVIEGVLAAAKADGYADVEICPFHILPTLGTSISTSCIGRNTIRHLAKRGRKLNVGVLFENDSHAIAAIAECHELGISVPEEIGLIGLDGSDSGSISWPSLTSFQHPAVKLAEACVDIIFNKIAGKAEPREEVTFPCELIIRNSTRPIAS